MDKFDIEKELREIWRKASESGIALNHVFFSHQHDFIGGEFKDSLSKVTIDCDLTGESK